MEESLTPVPDPSGALVPPGNRPPTTTTTALLPSPEPGPRRLPPAERSRWQRLLASTKALVNAVLDLTDDAVDRVAETVGLRRGPTP
ncbi:hypothetical protein [Roseisolibacter agri]|uniref:Uncharacterized protein n=1 Tax=Roseisolibacter agri TaxID=2014610 RepID=A0AA37Q2K2_9BACT|nr:hypothetical protein [Roseisolibacter agri]GLC25415.1 hypothetical protein rosag_19280 [Roseisolibacter agri]